MDNINWDKWQEQVDEHKRNCPWLDEEDDDREYQAEDEAEDEVLGDDWED